MLFARHTPGCACAHARHEAKQAQLPPGMRRLLHGRLPPGPTAFNAFLCWSVFSSACSPRARRHTTKVMHPG